MGGSQSRDAKGAAILKELHQLEESFASHCANLKALIDKAETD